MRERHNILLVEDNELDVELARVAFEARGLLDSLTVVRDGQEALDYLRRQSQYRDRPAGEPQLILLDLNMPRVNGFQVLSALRTDRSLTVIPVVVFSTSSAESDRRRCAELGARGYLTKPATIDEFQQAVGQLTDTWLEPTVNGN